MSSEEQTVKCPIYGEPYTTYGHYAGNQSACPTCRLKAERQTRKRQVKGWREE